MKRQQKTYSAISSYWRAYGGLHALISSPYFGFSVVFTLALGPLWWRASSEGKFEWVSLALSVAPGLLGFSLGAIAILIAFSDERLSTFIHRDRETASYFLSVVATFFHFIFIQFFSILSALFVLAYEYWALSGIAFLFFMYSVFSALACGAALFGFARIIDTARKTKVAANGEEVAKEHDSKK